jgi:hypothetical protein
MIKSRIKPTAAGARFDQTGPWYRGRSFSLSTGICPPVSLDNQYLLRTTKKGHGVSRVVAPFRLGAA